MTKLERNVAVILILAMIISAFSVGVYAWNEAASGTIAIFDISTAPPSAFQPAVMIGGYVVEHWLAMTVLLAFVLLLVVPLHKSMSTPSDERYRNLVR